MTNVKFDQVKAKYVANFKSSLKYHNKNKEVLKQTWTANGVTVDFAVNGKNVNLTIVSNVSNRFRDLSRTLRTQADVADFLADVKVSQIADLYNFLNEVA